jgi:hypothetical protein
LIPALERVRPAPFQSEEPATTFPVAITLFTLFGALFGLATYSRRHLFSEGHTKRAAADLSDPMQSRLAWVLLCVALWPLMVLTGAFSWWVKRPR